MSDPKTETRDASIPSFAKIKERQTCPQTRGFEFSLRRSGKDVLPLHRWSSSDCKSSDILGGAEETTGTKAIDEE